MPTLPPTITAAPRRGRRVLHVALGASWIAIALPLLFWGWDYYATPLSLRPDHVGHDQFRPTGLLGNRLGVFGTALLAFGVVVYLLRKRWGRLQGVGKLRDWLSFHIWCCTLGPFLVLLHTSFKVGGLVSIAFWSMVAVVASGVLGRYVYVHIPKAVNGRFLAREEVEAERAALLTALADRYSVAPEASGAGAPGAGAETRGLGRSLAAVWRANRAGRREGRRLRQRLREAGAGSADVREALALAARSRRLALGAAVLHPFGRLFRYWHAVHLPLAIVMALVLLLHIAVAVAFGYAWT